MVTHYRCVLAFGARLVLRGDEVTAWALSVARARSEGQDVPPITAAFNAIGPLSARRAYEERRIHA